MKFRAAPVFLLCLLLSGAVFLFVAPSNPAAADKPSTNPLAGQQLYIDSNNDPAGRQAAEWQATRPADAEQLRKISQQPKAYWLGGSTTDVRQAAADYTGRASAAGKVGVIVAYNIPSRDCGSYSAGGADSYTSYRSWIDNLAAGIASHSTVVILEPDALPQLSCLDDAGRNARLQALAYATTKLKQSTATSVYIDIGNKNWLKPSDAAEKLRQAGVAAADGFSLNVSNFYTTADTVSYGNDISARIGDKHFVIDTSRNGVETGGVWCNPAGAALGQPPTTTTGHLRADAYLWVKIPGESDGLCNGGPAAGSWWPEYALGLAQRAIVMPTPTAMPSVVTPNPATSTATTDAAAKHQNNYVIWILFAAVVGMTTVVIIKVKYRRP